MSKRTRSPSHSDTPAIRGRGRTVRAKADYIPPEEPSTSESRTLSSHLYVKLMFNEFNS